LFNGLGGVASGRYAIYALIVPERLLRSLGMGAFPIGMLAKLHDGD
jgi:hypothetical protein